MFITVFKEIILIGTEQEEIKMEIKKHLQGTSAVFEINGWLDTQAAPELEKALNELDPSVEELTIDMSGLEFISSSGLRQIVAAHKKMNGSLILKNLSAEILDVFNMAGFSKRLNIK